MRLSGEDSEVLVGNKTCSVISSSNTEVTCSAPGLVGGTHPILVCDPVYGDSNGDLNITYALRINSILPDQGGFGGIQILLNGEGYDPSGGFCVSVCGSPCIECQTPSNYTSVQCITPAKVITGNVTVIQCDVTVTNPDKLSVTLSNGFTYNATGTPSVSSVSPDRGGTAGGTELTIMGTGFA